MKRSLATALALVSVLAGCGSSDSRGRGDAPVGPYDDSPARIVNFPDQFANVAFKCLGHNGVYSTTREAPPVVVPNDPECPAR